MHALRLHHASHSPQNSFILAQTDLANIYFLITIGNMHNLDSTSQNCQQKLRDKYPMFNFYVSPKKLFNAEIGNVDKKQVCLLVHITLKFTPPAPPLYPLGLFVEYSGSTADCCGKETVYNHCTGLLDWTGGPDLWTDTKNHFYT